MNDPFELPSLEEIEQMERQRLQAIESLQITGHSVKCQRCRVAVPIVGKLTKISNDRISILQKRKWIENYSRSYNNLKALKEELANLLEEDAKDDKLRCLPLYSCSITGIQ
jgi:hypothetical protein